MGKIFRKKITIITVLLFSCLWSCQTGKQQSENVFENRYELLIFCSYRKYEDRFLFNSAMVYINAIESDSIRQHIYPERSLGRDILSDGVQLHWDRLKSEKNGRGSIILKNDFNHISYIGHDNIDLTKGANTIFTPSDLINGYSWTIDSIPYNELLDCIIILADPDYELQLGDSINIPHTSRLINVIEGQFGHEYKHVFMYDRDRQMIVAAELRDKRTNEIKLKYKLTKVIKITREDFYEFWTEPPRPAPEDSICEYIHDIIPIYTFDE